MSMYGSPASGSGYLAMPSGSRIAVPIASSSTNTVAGLQQYQRFAGNVTSSSSRPVTVAESVKARHFDPFKSLANDYRKLIMDTVADYARVLLEEQGLSEDLANDMRAVWEADCDKRSAASALSDESSSTNAVDNFSDNLYDESARVATDDNSNKRRYSLSRTESNDAAVIESKRYRSATASSANEHQKIPSQRHQKPEKDLMSEELDSDDDPSDEESRQERETEGSGSHGGFGSKSDTNSAEMSVILGLFHKVVRNKAKVWRIELENCILQVKHGEEMMEVPMVDVKIDAEWK